MADQLNFINITDINSFMHSGLLASRNSEVTFFSAQEKKTGPIFLKFPLVQTRTKISN